VQIKELYTRPDDLCCECAGEDNEEEMDEGSDAEREVAEGFLEDAKFAVEDRYPRIHSSSHCVSPAKICDPLLLFGGFSIPAFWA
jgi:hypothetical protein